MEPLPSSTPLLVLQYSGVLTEDREERSGLERKRKRTSYSFTDILCFNPVSSLELLKNRVILLEGGVGQVESKIAEIQHERVTTFFSKMIIAKTAAVSVDLEENLLDRTLPVEEEVEEEKALSFPSLIERIRNITTRLEQATKIVSDLEKSCIAEGERGQRSTHIIIERSWSTISSDFTKPSYSKLEGQLDALEGNRVILNAKMVVLQRVVKAWQIKQYEAMVLNEGEAQTLLELSLKFVGVRQAKEKAKSGLSNFTIPRQMFMECQSFAPHMAVASCESVKKQGKSDNQDRYFYSAFSHVTCFGVCDGHGKEGGQVAEMISQRLPKIFERAFAKITDLSQALLVNMTRQAFWEMDQELLQFQKAGSTLTCVLQTPLGLIFANIGDSRAVLDRRGKARQCTADQSVGDPFFVQAVEERGAKVGSLSSEPNVQRIMPARALITADMGNHAYQTEGVKHLSCIPEITFISYDQINQGNSFLIIASDSLWDYVNSQQAVDALRSCLTKEKNLMNVVQELVAACYHAGGERFRDDTTIMVVKL